MKRIGRKTIALLLAAALALPGLSAQGAEASVTAPAAVLMEASTGQVLAPSPPGPSPTPSPPRPTPPPWAGPTSGWRRGSR